MTEVRILFWNIAKKDLRVRIANLVAFCNVDILLLAENDIPDEELLANLNGGVSCYRGIDDVLSKITMFSRIPVDALCKVQTLEPGRLIFHELSLTGTPPVLLVGAHLPSQLYWGRDDQTLYAATVADDICEGENMVGHKRTVVIGDLNMDPFDPGVAGAGALHALMSAELALRESRTVAGEEKRMFYNPMWSLLGDRNPGPPGSFYHRSSKPLNYFWHMFDQTLLRPSLIPALHRVSIIDHDGQHSLLTSAGLPDLTNASDHLPLFVHLRF